jgi:peptide/nickel transport system substrate-binding protein
MFVSRGCHRRSIAAVLVGVALASVGGGASSAAGKSTPTSKSTSKAKSKAAAKATTTSTLPSVPPSILPSTTVKAKEPAKPETLRVALSFPPRAGLSITSDDAFLLTRLGVTETLVRANAAGEAQPLLASSWEQIAPTVWRFSLKQGVVFHDGKTLNAAGVVVALNYAATVAAPPRSLRGVGLKATAIDGLTVEVTTTRPDPLLPLRLSSPGSAILSPAAYGSGVPKVIGTGSGPFKLNSYVPEQRLLLSAYEAYRDAKPGIAEVEAKIILDPAARAAAVRAGEIDLAEGIPPSQIEAVKKDKNLALALYDLPRTTSIYLNTSSKPFNTAVARQAVDAAVDRVALATLLLDGAAEPAAGYFGPAVAWDPDKLVAPFNETQAKELVKKSGLKKVRLWTYPTRSELPEIAVAVKAMLERVGVEVDITVAEYVTQEPKVLGGEFDMFLLSRSYMVDVPDPAAFLTSDFTCAGSYNLNRYCDQTFDELLAPLATTTTRSARERIFALAARNLDVEAIGVPLLHDKARIAHTKKLSGLFTDPLEQRLLTAELRLAP